MVAAKKSAQEAFFKTILRKEGNCWSDFYKYVKRSKGSRENILSIKDSNDRIITDATAKNNAFNPYYSAVFNIRTIFLIYSVELQASHSPLIIKSSGELLKQYV